MSSSEVGRRRSGPGRSPPSGSPSPLSSSSSSECGSSVAEESIYPSLAHLNEPSTEHYSNTDGDDIPVTVTNADRDNVRRYFETQNEEDVRADEGDDGDSEVPFANEETLRESGPSWLHRVLSSIVKYCTFTVLIFGIAALLVAFGAHYLSPPKESLPLPTESYRRQMLRLLKGRYSKEYKENSNTKNVLITVGQKWIYKETTEPYVLLIVGRKASQFAGDIVEVFSNVTQRGPVDTVLCNSRLGRSELNRMIANSLEKESKTLVLTRIDKLRGETPLELHGLCDSDSSPYRSSLILLTVDGDFFGVHPHCEDIVSNFLHQEWETEFMNEDRIGPILSRITPFMICLEND